MPAEGSHYQSLSVQVAGRIAREIRNSTWVTVLPGERSLAEMLQVSRKTVRKSLAQLQREGMIQTNHGFGHRIVARLSPSAPPKLSVGLLTPNPIEQLPAYSALWIDELRKLLFENQIQLVTFSGRRFFTHRPDEALAGLMRQNPQTCWVLTHSHERIQQWLYAQEIPCIIAGSCHKGLPLPNIDLDHFAVCRHAVGTLIRHGHRRIVFLTQRSQRAGDLESEAGFADGLRRFSRANTEASVAHHDGTADGAYRVLARLFGSASPPTALLVAKPVFYLTTVAFLAQAGLRVAKDVSLVSRDYDSFLSYLKPAPACYSFSPKIYAKRLLPLVLTLLRENKITGETVHRIEPLFVAGSSLASLPKD